METVATIGKKAAEQQKEPLAGAYFWLLAFFLVYCARPEDYIPGLAHLHLARIVGFFALVAFVMSLGRLKQGFPKEIIFLILLLLQFFLASVFSPIWKGRSLGVTLEFSKVVLIVMVMVLAVTSLIRLRKLIFVQTASVAAVALVSVIRGRAHGGRLMGVLNGIYANPNDLALAVVLTLPFCLVFLLRTRSAFRKALWMLASLVMVYALFLTGSRAGFLAFLVAAAVCLWGFGVQGRRPHLLLIAFFCGMLIFAFAGKEVVTRLSDTSGANGNYQGSYSSAEHRRHLLMESLRVTAEYPIFGVGLENFQVISGAWQPTHNIYTALSSEAGLPALLLFLLVYRCAFLNLCRVKQKIKGSSELGMWVTALLASLLAFALAAFFFPDAYQFFVYFLFAYTTCAYGIAKEKEASGDTLETPNASSRPFGNKVQPLEVDYVERLSRQFSR
ncbi:MAG TPA: O-antigen ligase family protein [Terriglobia bacterium]|nr:O-antigen ligase family protein [Terriglobia bacterium]